MAPSKNAAPSRVTKPKRKNDQETSVPALRKSLRSQSKTKKSTPPAPTTTTPEPVNMPATTINATSLETQKAEDSPVYFWHPNQGNGYLGQWYWSQFTLDGDTYATAEMWMMVQKARLFSDEAIAKEMLATTDPKTHKALGRRVAGFDDKTWDEHKLRIVTEGNYHKFTRSEDAANLRGLLMATGERELVEASPRDRIWGVGFAEKNASANRHRWGQNLLGKAVMSVRERLRGEGEKAE